MAVEIVAPDYFQGQRWERREYLAEAARAAGKAVAAVHQPGDRVEICSGFIHRATQHDHPDWKIVKITGRFQSRIELALKEYLHGLGFPYEGSTEAYGKLFFESIRWLKGGNPARRGMEPDRLKLAKSGWRLFHVYQQNPYPEAVRIARQMKRQRSRARNEDATYDY